MPTMYTLTAMTGKEASANRTVVIGTIEFNWRVWMILVWAAPVALLATIVAWPFLGQVSLIMFPLVEGAAIFLIHRRSSQGLKLRTYQALWDKKRSDLNSFILCAQKIKVSSTDYRVLMQNAVAYVPPTPAPPDALVDALMARPAPEGVVTVAERDLPSDRPGETTLLFGAPNLSARFESQPATPPVGAPRPRYDQLDKSLIGREKDLDAVDVSHWLDTEPINPTNFSEAPQ